VVVSPDQVSLGVLVTAVDPLSAVMSDLKAQLAHTARVLAVLAILTGLGALVFAPSRSRVVRSFGWMFISISLIPVAIGRLVPDLVLARMSSDWAQALAVGLRVGGSRLIGLFVGLLCAGVVLLVLGALGPRIGSLLTPVRTPGEREPRPSEPFPPAGRRQEAARPPRTGQHFPEELAITRPMETVHRDDPRYPTPPSGYPYPQSYPQSQPPPAFPGGQYPDYGPYGEQPTDQEPYGPPADGSDRWPRSRVEVPRGHHVVQTQGPPPRQRRALRPDERLLLIQVPQCREPNRFPGTATVPRPDHLPSGFDGIRRDSGVHPNFGERPNLVQ
jgi:hypothetical protein